MPFAKKYLSIILKLSVIFLSIIGLAAVFCTWGDQAWRLYSTWFLIISILYFAVDLIYLLSRRKAQSENIAKPSLFPRFAAGLALNGLIFGTFTLISQFTELELPLNANGFAEIIIAYILPILILLNWIFFVEKGKLQISDPFYFLAPALIYSALIIITADQITKQTPLLYPYSFLDFVDQGIGQLLFTVLIFSTVTLSAGYAMFAVDLAASGKLSRLIVLPKIRTVVLVDAPQPDIILSTQGDARRKTKARSRREVISVASSNDSTSKPDAKIKRPTASVKSATKDGAKTKTAPTRRSKANAKQELKNASASAKNTTVNLNKPTGKKNSSKKSSRAKQSNSDVATSEPKTKKQQKLANVGKLQPIVDQAPQSEEVKVPSKKGSRVNQRDKEKVTPVIPSKANANTRRSDSKKSEFKIPNTAQKNVTSDKSKSSASPEKSSPSAAQKTNSPRQVSPDSKTESEAQAKSEFHVPDQQQQKPSKTQRSIPDSHSENKNTESSPSSVENTAKKQSKENPKSSIRHF